MSKLKAINFLNDLFITAYLTTRGTIMSMIQILAKRPELQKSLQREVDSVIGSDREPSLADRRSCHLTEAFIIESLRYISHVPLLILHAASQDTRINGFTIDKNTIVSLRKNFYGRFFFGARSPGQKYWFWLTFEQNT